MTKTITDSANFQETKRETFGAGTFVYFDVAGRECFAYAVDGKVRELRWNDASDAAIRRTSKLGAAIRHYLGEK